MKQKKILFLAALFTVSAFAGVNCPDSNHKANYGDGRIDNFTCYVGHFDSNTSGYVFYYTDYKDLSKAVLADGANGGSAPECSVSDSDLATKNSGKNWLDINKVVDYCKDNYSSDVLYITIPYGMDKMASGWDSKRYNVCIYYKNGGWIEAKEVDGLCPEVISAK
jgi:hypothetical protein